MEYGWAAKGKVQRIEDMEIFLELKMSKDVPVKVNEVNPSTLSAVSEVSFVFAVTAKTPLAAEVYAKSSVSTSVALTVTL